MTTKVPGSFFVQGGYDPTSAAEAAAVEAANSATASGASASTSTVASATAVAAATSAAASAAAAEAAASGTSLIPDIATSTGLDFMRVTADKSAFQFIHPAAVPAAIGLSTVATSGLYSDLSGKPTIPSGQAASKDVTDNTKAKVSSVSGAFTVGHMVVAADTSGTLQDGGSAVVSVAGRTGAVALSTSDVSGLGNAAGKIVTDNVQTKVASVTGSFTTGHLLVAADANGTAQDGGPVPAGGGGGAVTSVAGRTGVVVLASSDISGLAASATTDATNATNLTSGTLPAARLPAPTAISLGGVNSKTATTHQFVTSIATDGSVVQAQPAAADITGLAASATTDTTVATNITSGTLPAARLPAPTVSTLGGVNSKGAVTHQFVTSIATDGSVVQAQPTASDISGLVASATTDTTNASNITGGTLPATCLPTPTGTTLGGVKSKTATTHQFVTQIGTDGSITQAQPATTDISGFVDTTPASIEFVIDGSGSVITTGLKGYLEVPFACTINRATMLADQSGSIVVDVWKCTEANFAPGTHPIAADKITASAPPTISSGVKAQDSTLTGWTTSVSAGDILAFNVNSVTTVQRVTLSLKVART